MRVFGASHSLNGKTRQIKLADEGQHGRRCNASFPFVRHNPNLNPATRKKLFCGLNVKKESRKFQLLELRVKRLDSQGIGRKMSEKVLQDHYSFIWELGCGLGDRPLLGRGLAGIQTRDSCQTPLIACGLLTRIPYLLLTGFADNGSQPTQPAGLRGRLFTARNTHSRQSPDRFPSR